MATRIELTLLDCGALEVVLDEDLSPEEIISLGRKAGNLLNKYRHPAPPEPKALSNDGGQFGFAPPSVWGQDPDATITC
jgi:hypothetical protein